MLKIYDVENAKRTILRRKTAQESSYPPALLARLEALFSPGVTPPQAVAIILTSVREDGDAALRRWSSLLDHHEPERFLVPVEQLAEAYAALPDRLRQALTIAAGRIRDFHARQPLPSWQTGEMGGMIGQRVTPVRRVGVYVPGGTAPLPSSLLMSPFQITGMRYFCAVGGSGKCVIAIWRITSSMGAFSTRTLWSPFAQYS